MQTIRSHILNRQSRQGGFLLPIVVITGLILGAGIMALSARTFGNLIGSIRQGQSREAQEAAEAGLTILTTELNRNYPYLLISSCIVDPTTAQCNGWLPKGTGSGSWEAITSVCPNTATSPTGIQSKLKGILQGGRSRYELISYRFEGDKQQGGIGKFKIKGESYVTAQGSTGTRATAVVEQTLSIVPKGCRSPVFSATTEGGFAGLLSETVDMGNNDLTGAVNANIMCMTCPTGTKTELVDDVKLGNQGVVTGSIYGGPLALPPVDTFPGIASNFTRAVINNNTTFVAGQTNGNSCLVDSGGITHCLIQYINLDGSGTLCIYSEPGTYTNTCSNPSTQVTVPTLVQPTSPATSPPVNPNGIRFYFDLTDAQSGAPNSKVVTVSGNGGIIHTGSPVNLAFFGLPRSPACSPPLSYGTQTITLQGGSQAVGMFVYFPDGKVGINGGSSTPDVTGAIWACAYGGSNSNRVELAVPPNMGSLVWEKFGSGFKVGVGMEFAAIGSTSWRTFQVPTR